MTGSVLPGGPQNIGRVTHSRAHTCPVPGEVLVAAGASALADGRWADARATFETALAEQETPDALDGLGEALWWLGDPLASVACRERAYVGFRRAGDPVRAARAALAACLTYGVNFGNVAACTGWFARARSVFPDGDPGPLRGEFWLLEAYFGADPDAACELLRRVLAEARTTGDVDLELSALSDLGGRLVDLGRHAEGLALIDQALAGALAGECRRRETVVWASCTMLGACETAGDLGRASQWLRVIDEFTDRYGCPFMYATCRTHYGGLLLAKGLWRQAEQELAAAIRMSGRAGPVPHAMAVARLAELRLGQGRGEEAEVLLGDGGDDLVRARLLISRGEPAAAIDLLERCSGGGRGATASATVLLHLVEAQLATGRLDEAAGTAGRMATLAAAPAAEFVVALAQTAAGHVALARGDSAGAAARYHSALSLLTGLELPLAAAQARLALARACARFRPLVAVAEAREALAVLDEVGAKADADAAAALLRALGAPGRRAPRTSVVLTRREQDVLRLVELGLTNREIAGRLFISPKTAAHHVSSLLSKLGYRNRVEAAAHRIAPPEPAQPPS
jgi:ATP/maltotriose-dependent transcriptional regulator MalT